MSDSVLAPGKTRTFSDEIQIAEGTLVLVSVYTATGKDLSFGPILTLQFKDINDSFVSVKTPKLGEITFSSNCQHVILGTPGTYRVYRPDLSSWSDDVGVEVLVYPN